MRFDLRLGGDKGRKVRQSQTRRYMDRVTVVGLGFAGGAVGRSLKTLATEHGR